MSSIQSPYTVTYAYQPMRGLLTWLYGLLAVSIGLYSLAMVSRAVLFHVHPELLAMQTLPLAQQIKQMEQSPPELVIAAGSVGCVGGAELVVRAAWYVLFLIWVYRAVANARALGAQGLRFSPTVCVMGLLPLVNLVMSPFVLFELLWAHARHRGPAATLAVAWWLCLLGAVAMSMSAGALANPQGFNRPGLLLPLSLIQLAFGVTQLILTILLIHRVQRLHQIAAVAAWSGPTAETNAWREPWDD